MGPPIGPGGVFCPSVDTESLYAIPGMCQLFLAVPSILGSGPRRLRQVTEALSEPRKMLQRPPCLHLVFSAAPGEVSFLEAAGRRALC